MRSAADRPIPRRFASESYFVATIPPPVEPIIGCAIALRRRINRTAPSFASRCGPICRLQEAPSRPSVLRASPEICRPDAPGSSKEPQPLSALPAGSSSIPFSFENELPLSSDEPLSHAFAKARSGELINGKCGRRSDQPHPLQTRVPIPADDDVVVHGYAERGCDGDDRFRHLDVGLRRRRI